MGEPTSTRGLEPDKLTWAVLLGRWVDFARGAVALPDDAEGRSLRAAVPDLIMLQAVWFALEHLDDLPRDEVMLGLDRAEVLLEKHAGALARRWPGEAMPGAVRELMDDAAEQLARARTTWGV